MPFMLSAVFTHVVLNTRYQVFYGDMLQTKKASVQVTFWVGVELGVAPIGVFSFLQPGLHTHSAVLPSEVKRNKRLEHGGREGRAGVWLSPSLNSLLWCVP